MNVEVLTTLAAIDAARSRWNDLFTRTRSTNYFVTHGWIRACVAAFPKAGEPRIYVVTEGDRFLAVGPLMGNGRRLAFLMIPDLADYCEFLVEEGREDALAQLLDRVLADHRWRRVALDGLPINARCVEPLLRILKRAGVCWQQRVICSNPAVQLKGDFEGFYRSVDKKLRQEVRTTRNHLRRRGEVRVEEAESGAQARAIYDSLVALHLQRQSGKIGRSLFDRAAIRDFLRELIPNATAERSDGPVMSALELDGRVIAAAYSLRCNGCFFYWIPSFDAALRSMSLGKALIAELIERRFAERCTVFDFMGGEEKYKYQWSNGEYDVISVSIYRSRLEGVAARVAMVVRARLRRALAGRRWLIRLRVALSNVFAPRKGLS